MKGLTAMLGKEVREQWRTGRLPVVAVVFLFFGLASPLIARYTPEIIRLAAGPVGIPLPVPASADAVNQLIKNLNQVGVLTAVLLAMGSVAGEKVSGTAGFVLVKPVDRLAFLIAKFGALALTLTTGVVVGGLFAYLYTALLFTPLDAAGFGAACLVLLMTLLEITSLAFLGSVLARSPVAAAAIGAAAIVVAGIVSAIPHVGGYTPFGLNQLARDLALRQVGMDWTWQLVANGALVVAALAASWLVFRRQAL